jgi:hypothetical protein
MVTAGHARLDQRERALSLISPLDRTCGSSGPVDIDVEAHASSLYDRLSIDLIFRVFAVL